MLKCVLPCLLCLFLTTVCALTNSIEDIQHIVIYMQENRPYDHYYGTLRGGRGFADRTAPKQPDNTPIWYQKTNTTGYILPFHLPFDQSKACCMNAPEMDYLPDINIFNGGKMDRWNSAREPGFGMSHFNRSDLPYYYALADTFTFGDHYYQSTYTATCPNREHLFSGSNGLSVGGEYIMMNDEEPLEGFPWETMGETLEKAGLSWKVFQQEDNFDDNGFAWFTTFKNSKPGEHLWDKGLARSDDVVEQFASAVRNNSLPAVSWIVGPSYLAEHATYHPQDGEDLSARLLAVLGDPANKKVWEKTALILNYDEGGQFFDHLWTPVPPKNKHDGISTVTTKGEITTKEVIGVEAGNPIGLGFRVPLFVISPWSRGGYVFSEVSDHTSVIKFVEKRFNVRCPNISPWRRAMVSDLTWAFNFTHPDFSAWPTFPNTSNNTNQSKAECEHLPAPALPKKQNMPSQEPGSRPSRRLPYQIEASATLLKNHTPSLLITIVNSGDAGVVLFMYDRVNPHNIPRKYSIEAGKTIEDVIDLSTSSASSSPTYGFSLHGPNGFVRQFGGPLTTSTATVLMRYSIDIKSLVFVLSSATNRSSRFVITDNAYGAKNATVVVPSNSPLPILHTVSIQKSGCWYDFSVSVKGGYVWRFMGRMETLDDSVSDPASDNGKAPVSLPAAGYPVGMEGSKAYDDHSDVPDDYTPPRWRKSSLCATARSRILHKDACWDVRHEEL